MAGSAAVAGHAAKTRKKKESRKRYTEEYPEIMGTRAGRPGIGTQ